MRLYKKILMSTLILTTSCSLLAATQLIEKLKISKIRSVGNYHVDDTFDSTIELWFTKELNFTSALSCTQNFRVYVDTQHTHVVSAAYMALLSGKEVAIHIDDNLPKRSGSCEISYLDVLM